MQSPREKLQVRQRCIVASANDDVRAQAKMGAQACARGFLYFLACFYIDSIREVIDKEMASGPAIYPEEEEKAMGFVFPILEPAESLLPEHATSPKKPAKQRGIIFMALGLTKELS